MTNDNLPITNAEMAEAATLPLDEFFDIDGNVIPFDTEEDFIQAAEDIKVDTGNTVH